MYGLLVCLALCEFIEIFADTQQRQTEASYGASGGTLSGFIAIGGGLCTNNLCLSIIEL
jgi:hypothetical protein